MTIQRDGQPDIHIDEAQKLFCLAPGTALGFVGNLSVASELLGRLFSQVESRRRRDPMSLANWMPRFFKTTYAHLLTKRSIRTPDVAFMVASVLRDRPNVVLREDVAEIVRQIGWGKSAVERNWMPGLLIKILQIPAEKKFIRLDGSCQGLLYILRSPQFEIEAFRPLQFAAIGSGELVFESIARCHDMIVAGEPGNSFIESLHFREAIRHFINEKRIPSVGGLYPVLKVTGERIEQIGLSTEVPYGGTKIELTASSEGQWIQRNVTSGREMLLVPPWKIDEGAMESRLFDDLEQAHQRIGRRSEVIR